MYTLEVRLCFFAFNLKWALQLAYFVRLKILTLLERRVVKKAIDVKFILRISRKRARRAHECIVYIVVPWATPTCLVVSDKALLMMMSLMMM